MADVAEKAGIGPLLTEDEYARVWRVTTKTVRAWGRKGLVKVWRRGRVVRYLLDVPDGGKAEPGETAPGLPASAGIGERQSA